MWRSHERKLLLLLLPWLRAVCVGIHVPRCERDAAAVRAPRTMEEEVRRCPDPTGAHLPVATRRDNSKQLTRRVGEASVGTQEDWERARGRGRAGGGGQERSGTACARPNGRESLASFYKL